ncbi:MAG: hypothetical protein WC881_06940 [Elusimicrobiota bacterium]
MHATIAAVLLALTLAPAQAQEEYGAKGIYPVYETSGQWLIFDKNPKKTKGSNPLALGVRFLVIGSQGADVFTVARASATYGGACKNNRPVRLRTALLKGPRLTVGTPIIGIKVGKDFKLKGSRARYLPLKNQVTESVYAKLGEALKAATAQDIEGGAFKPEGEFALPPRADQSQTKIDFGAHLNVPGAADAFVLVEGTQVAALFRRCLRLADVDKLIGGCIQMPHALMAETGLLRFVAYDPSGQGNPFLLAYTAEPPMWGDERWGFVLRSSGPKMFLSDAMDTRCREGF